MTGDSGDSPFPNLQALPEAQLGALCPEASQDSFCLALVSVS